MTYLNVLSYHNTFVMNYLILLCPCSRLQLSHLAAIACSEVPPGFEFEGCSLARMLSFDPELIRDILAN